MISLFLVLPMVLLAQGTSLEGVERTELDAPEWNDVEGSLPELERGHEDSRIIGGSKAGLVNYYASIRYITRHWCGGSVISKQHILTAGHCTAGKKAAQLGIVLGLKSISGGGTFYKCGSIINHKDYNGRNFDNDIALLRSEEEFNLSDKIAIIALATALPQVGATLLLIGLGATRYPQVVNPDDVMWINTTLISMKDCKAAHKGSGPPGAQITEKKQGCTYIEKGKGGCKGDSGGPVVNAAVPELVLLVSWGAPCAVGKPDVDTAIPYYLTWIKDNMK